MSTWRLLIFGLAVLCTACSLVFGLEAEQCATDGDCRARGGDFQSSVCVAGYCRAPDQAPGCSSNAECTGKQLCKEQICTTITNGPCPAVIGEQHLRAESPIVFAIVAPISGLDFELSNDMKNYVLAMSEFESELPGGALGKHPFAALVCDSRQAELSMKHAIETVGVPAVLSQLETDDLVPLFESIARKNRVFILSAHEADSTLTSIKDDSLIWHMLGSTSDLTAVYDPLLARIEAHLALSEPIRIALIENAEVFEQDLANSVSENLLISGTPASSYPGFSRHLVVPGDSAKANALVQKLLTEVRPHVVISAAGDEFISGVMNPVEIAWKTVVGTAPPFYVLSIENRTSVALFELFKARPDLRTRSVGVNYASAKDPTLKNGYLQRFKKMFPEALSPEGYENYYDTMYYLLYSFVGAGNVATYTGDDVARGMGRLLSGLPIYVGPVEIAKGAGALGSGPNTAVELIGVMGPPDFNPGSGARISEGSVWCVDASAKPLDDVLRLNETGDELVGDFPCFAF